MTLAELRVKFEEFTGRYDLTSTQIDFFINSGHRYLESLINSPRSLVEDEVNTVAGTSSLIASNYRAIKEVWIKDTTQSDNPWVKLGKISHSEYLAYYADTNQTNSMPKYWTFYTDDQKDATNPASTGVTLLPTPDAVYNMRIIALQSTVLDNVADHTWWTDRYPDVVLYASMYSLENFYRNTEGAKDWHSAIMSFVDGIDKDNVESEIGDIRPMDDSYELDRGRNRTINSIIGD